MSKRRCRLARQQQGGKWKKPATAAERRGQYEEAVVTKKRKKKKSKKLGTCERCGNKVVETRYFCQKDQKTKKFLPRLCFLCWKDSQRIDSDLTATLKREE